MLSLVTIYEFPSLMGTYSDFTTRMGIGSIALLNVEIK